MNFLDRTGHIFHIDSYDSYPIGYEYQETPYIFWFETEKGYKLSVDNYYVKPIRIVTNLLNVSSENTVNIKIENSDKFFLIGSKIIEEEFMNHVSDINDPISLNEEYIKNSKELNYHMSLNLENNSFTYDEDDSNDLNGIIAEESEILMGEETYYVLFTTLEEINSDDIIVVDNSLVGNTYMDKDLNEVTITSDMIGKKLTEVTVADNKSYYELLEKKRYVPVTNENQNSLNNIKTTFELYLINTFYVLVNSKEPGTWSTNVLINVNDEWCPITIAAEIIDEREELVINGKNFGIELPKEIINAVYSSNINTVVPDVNTYNLKMKEYFMNYMTLKGEIGNYRSALNGLKWFEWNDKLSISKLIKNDNRVQKQYIKDFFDIINDNIYSYQLFKETSLLSLELNLYEEGDDEIQHLDNYFWGEGKPVISSILNKNKEILYDEKEYPYIRGYFDYTFSDLGLKLCFLKYYYEKYFLPIYIKIHNISMGDKVYANDIKLINKVSHGITGKPFYIDNEISDTYISSNSNENTNTNVISSNEVIFNHNNFNVIYFNREYKKDKTLDYSDENKLFIDTNYNEFSNYTKEFVENDDNIYYEINDTCLRIPITFTEDKYYDVTLILSRYINNANDNLINEDDSSNLYNLLKTSFKFIQSDNKRYQSLILYPKHVNERVMDKFDSLYWLNNTFRLDLIINGKLYEYVFTVKMPELNIELGTLKYRYDKNFRQVSSLEGGEIKLNTYMYCPNLVNVNNYNFNEEIVSLSDNLTEYVNAYYKESMKFLNKKYLNTCHLLDLTDNNGNIIKYAGPEEPISWDSLNQFVSYNNANINLYRNFFNDDGSYNFDLKILNINKHSYDLYLMHDYEQWYVVLISKEPFDNTLQSDKKFKFYNNLTSIKIGDYILKYVRSDRKFLINRFMYVPSNGDNHFDNEDIITVSLKNNDKLCFKLSQGSKWVISSLSLGMKNNYIIKSNTELAIISIYKDLPIYETGYYSIEVNYCIDDYVQHSYTKRASFMIDKQKEKITAYNYPSIDEILS